MIQAPLESASCRQAPKGALAVVLGAWTLLSACLPARAAEPLPGSASPGLELFAKHDFAGASAAFQGDLQVDPKDSQALIYLGRIAMEQNRVKAAAQYFEQATAAAPQNSSAFHWLGRVYGVQARDLGPPLGIGPARRTRKALEKAVLLDAGNVEARVDLATFYRQAPGIVGGSTRAALEQLREIDQRNPYLGHLVHGDMAMDEKRFDEAERQYQAALQLDSTRTDAYCRLGILNQHAGRYQRAFDAFETALRLDPKEKAALFQIGKTADLSGQRPQRGIEALKLYMQSPPFYVMPKLTWAHRRLGNIYLKQGQREAARAEFMAAVKTGPDDKEAAAALKQLESADTVTFR